VSKSLLERIRGEAYALLKQERSEEALEKALELFVLAPQNAESYLLAAEIAEAAGACEDAFSFVNQGLHQKPEDLGLLLKKASILLDDFEELEEAFTVLKHMEALVDKSKTQELNKELCHDMALLLCDCYRLQNDFKNAFYYAKKAHDYLPKSENARLTYANAQFELGNYEEALNLLGDVGSYDNKSDYYWLKAQIQCASADFAGSEELFQKAHKSDKSRYHSPVRISQNEFLEAVTAAYHSFPKEIQEKLATYSFEIAEIVPRSYIENSAAKLSPLALTLLIQAEESDVPSLIFFQKNFENMASSPSDIKKIAASAILHEVQQS
jgi:tetratricopeptide (TPR) repeat protein